jgi:DNA-binding response OmpR family regulator
MKVLVVEDDPDVAFMLQRALQHEGFEVVICSTGGAAVRLNRISRPDVVLLDHGLPDIDGRESVRRIRIESRVPIIVVTGRTDEAERVASLEAGADDYVAKPFSVPELVARIRAVLRRVEAQADPDLPPLTFKDLRLDRRTRRVAQEDRNLELTKIEYDILESLLVAEGAVVARSELARGIWNASAATVRKSIDVHVSVLRKKLGDDPDAPRYIETVRGIGFRLATG